MTLAIIDKDDHVPDKDLVHVPGGATIPRLESVGLDISKLHGVPIHWQVHFPPIAIWLIQHLHQPDVGRVQGEGGGYHEAHEDDL